MLHRTRPPRGATHGLARGLAEGGGPVVEETVENPASMRDLRAAVATHKPKAVVLAESFDDGAICEAEPDRAYRENAEAAISLAAAALEFGAKAILLSTSEVYGQGPGPWSEAEKPEPISGYANSMLRAEQFLLRAAKTALVLRVSALYGDGLRAEAARLQAGQGSSPQALVSPITAFELGRAVRALVEADAQGVYHVAASGGPPGRGEVDQLVIEALALSVGPLKTPEGRPRSQALFADRLKKIVTLPSWEQALRAAAQAAPPLEVAAPSNPAGDGLGLLFASTSAYQGRLHRLAAGARLAPVPPRRPTTWLVVSGKVLVEVTDPSGGAPTDHVLRPDGHLEVAEGTVCVLAAVEASIVVEIG